MLQSRTEKSDYRALEYIFHLVILQLSVFKWLLVFKLLFMTFKSELILYYVIDTSSL